MYSKLHIYPTEEPSGECVIVGDRKSLLELAKSLQRAASYEVDYQKYYAGDGHQFRVVVCKEQDKDVWENLKLPYTDPVFKEDRDSYVPYENLEPLELYYTEKHKLK